MANQRFDGRGAMVYTPHLDPYSPNFSSVPDFGKFIQGRAVLTVKDTKLDSTVLEIRRMVREGRGQLAPLAKHLKSGNTLQNAYNVWRFMKDEILYRLDRPGSEQIRNPARTWADRSAGVDCEDYTIFAACCLLEMGIKVDALIVAFDNEENRARPERPRFGHIYNFVAGQYPLDVVLNLFNVHPPNVFKTVIVPLNF